MDQGQASINFFNWVNESGKSYVNRTPWHLQHIDREVDYDINADLQVTHSAYTHIPRSRLLQIEPGQFSIPEDRMVWPPFEFTIDMDDWVSSHAEVFNKNAFRPDLNEVTTPMNFDVLTLWASDKSQREFVRKNQAFKSYKEMVLREPPTMNHRMVVLYKALHTLMQYDPPNFFKSIGAGALNNKPQQVMVFKRNIIQVYRAFLGKYSNITGSLEMLTRTYENDLNSTTRRQMRINRYYTLLRSMINAQQLVPLFRRGQGKEFAMYLWLFSPHSSHQQEVNENSEFCLAYLALYVLEGKFLSISEWTLRKNQGINSLSHTQDLHGANSIGNSNVLMQQLTRLRENLMRLKGHTVVSVIPGATDTIDQAIEMTKSMNDLYGLVKQIITLVGLIRIPLKFAGIDTTVVENIIATVEDGTTAMEEVAEPLIEQCNMILESINLKLQI